MRDATPVLDYLAAQDRALRAGERVLRAGDPAGVHPSRVGARRARSTLRTFAGLFESGARREADLSLREYAARLGEVRDLQVLRQVLAGHASGGLADWVEESLAKELQAGWHRLELELLGNGHRRLSDGLDSLLLAGHREIDVERCVHRAGKKAERKLARAGDDVERLHDARKAAKRARYAAEATGRRPQAEHFQRLQDLLGTHHDLVVAARWLEGAAVPSVLRAEARALGVHLHGAAERARLDALQ